jgi:acetylornithine/succinyldiaminopimelate/putrescine aminotransferase/predicted amino acid dehydrogenase
MTRDSLPHPEDSMNRYGHFCRPAMVPLLEALGLDATYVKADGDYLYYRRGGVLTRVLDMLGGYGANLFGHFHPELVAEAHRLLEARAPIHAQASCRDGAARLAEALCRRLGDYVVTFTNSGTETIEAAIKHVHLERRRPIFWAIKGGFHGKTLGSIQFTWSYRQPYETMGPQVRFLDPLDPADLDAAALEADDVAAVFLEPIAGEGGIKPLPAEFAARLRDVCSRHDIPIVADEIQTGMGRTGTFLASEALGIEPDYICLGKSLGGGLAKIGALLVARRRFVPEFSLHHTSTFAEDDFSCGIALKALELIESDDVLGRCADRGQFLIDALDDVRARYPHVIEDIRGRGMMVGIQLRDQSDANSHLLRMLSQQGHLGYTAAGYMLNVHDIRLAPTLTQPFTLRLEPSAYVSQGELQRTADAVETLCQAVASRDVAHFTAYRYAPTSHVSDHRYRPRAWKTEAARTPQRVAFIGHLLAADDIRQVEPSLAHMEADRLEAYVEDGSRLLEPCIFDEIDVQSATGTSVHLSFVGLTLTSRQIAKALEGPDRDWMMAKLESAVALARDRGNQVVGFGGYTSILSANCRRVHTTGIGVTTGNSLTTGMGILAIRQAAEELGIDMAGASLAVVGATGNIASTYATMIAPSVRELVLVVRNTASPKLRPLLARLRAVAPHVRVDVVDDIAAVSRCQLIVAASNVPEPLIYPQHLAAGPVAICDISLPSDVSDQVRHARPDVLVIRGGIVRLPFNDDFSIAGISLPRGHALACMSETLLMGLEGLRSNGSVGPVTEDGVRRTLAWAATHGFRLADIRLTAGPARNADALHRRGVAA